MKATLQMALDWIEGNGKYADGDKIAAIIKEALAQQCVCGEPDSAGTHRTDGPCLAPQPEQEPLAFLTNRRQRLNVEFNATGLTLMPKSVDWKIPLYTTPPQRKPLTDEQIYQMWTDEGLANSYEIYSLKEHVRRAARAIEAAHGIKE